MRSNKLDIDGRATSARCWSACRIWRAGYQFEAAEASFELLGRRSAPGYKPPFELLDVVVISERGAATDAPRRR